MASCRRDLLGALNVLVPLSLRDNLSNVDLRFLAAAQTLEALARIGRETLEMPEDVFNRRVQGVMSLIGDEEVASWVSRKLAGANFVSQRRLLRALYKEIGGFAKRVFPNREEFLAKHIELLQRHYPSQSCRRVHRSRRDVLPHAGGDPAVPCSGDGEVGDRSGRGCRAYEGEQFQVVPLR